MRALAVIAAGLLVACADAPEVEARQVASIDELIETVKDDARLKQEQQTPEDAERLQKFLEEAQEQVSNWPTQDADAENLQRVRKYRACLHQLGEDQRGEEICQAMLEKEADGFGEVFGIARTAACENDPDCRANTPALDQAEMNKIWQEMLAEVRKNADITCKAIPAQGGLAICQTAPDARVEVGRSETDTYTQTAGPDGTLIVGFDRDEPNAFVRLVDKPDARVDFDIAKRDWDISRIDGLPSNMVSTYTDEELARIRSASARKKVGFASKVQEIGFRNGFISPIQGDYVKTTNFGAQRILNGEPKRPHFGVDLAAPKGTPIVAPADGIVSLADDDMYFEGSLIMIDHGQGLISYYLHNEEVLVEAGQRVTQGEQIATVGSRGRSTGPHLCWRLKWRGRNLDPELITRWQEEAVLQ